MTILDIRDMGLINDSEKETRIKYVEEEGGNEHTCYSITKATDPDYRRQLDIEKLYDKTSYNCTYFDIEAAWKNYIERKKQIARLKKNENKNNY